jgi:predicted ribosomally synthesized peptide with nif11-like leader
MSAADAERFVEDVAKDKALAERVKPHAAGLAALVAGAKTQGYTFTVDELKQAMRGKAKQNLNDAQLDAIAGGAGGSPPTSTAVSVVATQVMDQAVVVATLAPAVQAVVLSTIVVN